MPDLPQMPNMPKPAMGGGMPPGAPAISGAGAGGPMASPMATPQPMPGVEKGASIILCNNAINIALKHMSYSLTTNL